MEVISRSRVRFLICVGKSTCCVRLNDERSFRKSDARESEGMSTWMLKSPVSTNSLGVVAASERRELRSSRMEVLDLEE